MAAVGVARRAVLVGCAQLRYVVLARSLGQSAVGRERARARPSGGESAFGSEARGTRSVHRPSGTMHHEILEVDFLGSDEETIRLFYTSSVRLVKR